MILENHFSSLMDSSFYVRTSRPCALYEQKASSKSRRHPSPHLRQAGRIQPEIKTYFGWRFTRAADLGWMCGKRWERKSNPRSAFYISNSAKEFRDIPPDFPVTPPPYRRSHPPLPQIPPYRLVLCIPDARSLWKEGGPGRGRKCRGAFAKA